MKAAVINEFGPPEVLKIDEIQSPVPRAHEVLIKVHATSINPIDWKTRKGNLKFILGSNFPIVLGYDAAGTVVLTGSKVTKFKKGDQVYGRLDRKFGGALAEYAVGSENVFSHKPPTLSWEQAAAVPLAALTALQGLRDKGEIKKGQKILINGASGGVGHFALQIARYFETETTAVCSSRHQNMMKDLGPHRWIDYTKEDFKTKKDKYDIIFDTVGTETYLSCRHLLNPGGIYVNTLPRPKILYHRMISLFSQGKKVKTFLMKAEGTDLDFINQLIRENKFKIYVDKIFPLEQVSEAHKYSQTGKAEGKVVVKISDE